MSCSHRWIYGVGWAMSTVTKHPKLIAIGLYWFLHTIRSAYHILYLNFRSPNPITGQRWLRNKSPNSAHWALEVWWALHRVKSRVHAISPVSIDRIIFIKTNFTSWMDHSNPMILDFINNSFFGNAPMHTSDHYCAIWPQPYRLWTSPSKILWSYQIKPVGSS